MTDVLEHQQQTIDMLLQQNQRLVEMILQIVSVKSK